MPKPAIHRDTVCGEALFILQSLRENGRLGRSNKLADVKASLEPSVSLEFDSYYLFLRKYHYIALDPREVAVRHGDTAATWLGAASDVETASDGRGVWRLSRQDASRCALGQVGLDGRPRRPPRPAPCDAVLIDELPAGLLVYGADGPYSALLTADGAMRGSPRWWTA